MEFGREEYIWESRSCAPSCRTIGMLMAKASRCHQVVQTCCPTRITRVPLHLMIEKHNYKTQLGCELIVVELWSVCITYLDLRRLLLV